MLVPNRHGSSNSYRYGFNGMEKDDEVKGEGNSINYEARMQDTRVGRFLSVDPLTKSFPHYSPYQFAGNTPIQAIDLDGAEEYHYLAHWHKKTGKIVFVLESDKTVQEKSYFFGLWKTKASLSHNIVFKNGNGDESTYVFTTKGVPILMGFDSEIVNKTSDFKRFVEDSRTNIYKNEGEAVKTLDATFASEDAKDVCNNGSILAQVATTRDAFVTRIPVTEKALTITEKSVVDKLGKYLLNKEHPQGGSKAKWFERALGFTIDNLDNLAKQIKFDPAKAVSKGNNGHANMYEQIIPLTGTNGKKIDVQFNFAIPNGETAPKLVGAIPAKPTR